MSKKHSAAKKRRRKNPHPVLCPSCHQPPDNSPPLLLSALAALLNTAEQAGVKVRIRHGVLWTFHGIVMPPGKKKPWEARPFGVLPQSPAVAEDEAGDGMDE